MKPSFNELFFKILSILNYKNQESFINEFEKTNRIDAMVNCIEKLPKGAREEVIANIDNQSVIKKYITEENYAEEITKVSTKALAEFLQYLTPVLSNKQKEQIAAVFSN